MNTYRRLSIGTVSLLLAFASGAHVLGQSAGIEADHAQRVIAAHDAQKVVLSGQGEHITFDFMSVEPFEHGDVVKGAPYSAEVVNELVQTLADGNRITRKTSSSVFRDAAGRTRREHSLSAIGPFVAGGDAPHMVIINDPVAGIDIVLNRETRTARKLSPMMGRSAPPGMLHERPRSGARARISAPVGGTTFETEVPPDIVMPAEPIIGYRRDKAVASEESLGTQTIEGVQAEGRRVVTTIPAGQIGNEQPIRITSERWYSPELRTVVLSKHSDPRFGETIFRLTNIVRSEPPVSLFEVPGDYSVKTEPERHLRSKKPGLER